MLSDSPIRGMSETNGTDGPNDEELTQTEDETETESETGSSARSVPQLNDTETNLSEYHEKMLRMEQEDHSETEDQSATDSGSDTAVETETEATPLATLGYVITIDDSHHRIISQFWYISLSLSFYFFYKICINDLGM